MLSNWPAWLWLLVSVLAVYRLTRLITEDDIGEPIRDAVKQLGEPWATGIECPWCVSMWVSAGAVAVAILWPGTWQVGALILALSAVAGWAGSRE